MINESVNSYTEIGEQITFNTEDMENITKNCYIEKIEGIVPTFAEVKENTIDEILSDTPFKDVKTLFYSQPFETWDEKERENIVEQLENYISEVGELVDFAYEYNKDGFKRWETEYGLDYGGEELAGSIVKNINLDMSANNFRGASASIESYIDLVNDTISSLKEQCPDIDLDMPSAWGDQIRESAQSYDLIYGVDEASARGYKLLNSPDTDEISLLLNSTPDISIIETSGGDCYIGSNSSEINKNYVAYSYLRIDGNIPISLENKINFNAMRNEFMKEDIKDWINTNAIKSVHNKIQNNEEVPSSEFSKIDTTSEAFKSLDSEVQTTITNYINEQSDKIIAEQLEKDKLKQEQSAESDLKV